MTLSASQLSVLGQHAAGGDRVAYYTALSEFGIGYGDLALGVVLNDTTSGASANAYFLQTANDEVGTVSSNQLATISLQLMQADFTRRSALGGADLSVDDIQGYHEAVFQRVTGVSADAWTPNIYLDSFSTPTERQSAWDNLISSGAWSYPAISARRVTVVDEYFSNQANPPYLTTADLDQMSQAEMLNLGLDAGFVQWFVSYSDYLTDLLNSGIEAFFTSSSNQYGPYNISIPSSGDMIGGNQDDDTLQGGSGNDVVLGFDGDDTFNNSIGDDRYYGGAGSDTVSYSGEQQGISIQIGDLQSQASSWAPLQANGNEVLAVVDGSNSTDYLIDIENIIGSSLDDTLEIFGSIADIAANFSLSNGGIDAGTDEHGDTIDLSSSESSGVIAIFNDDGTTSFRELNDNWASSISVLGFENMVGTSQGDDIRGGSLDNRLDGGTGHDTISAGAEASTGNDTLIGGTGADMILTAAGNDSVEGGSGADFIEYLAGVDTIRGGEGNDYYYLNRATGTEAVLLLEDGFGHDSLSNTGFAIDRVVFEGVSSSDVSLIWDFGVQPIGNDVFMSGPAVIRVNSTGDTLYIPMLSGQFTYVGVPPYPNYPNMQMPFALEFTDGVFTNWFQVFGAPWDMQPEQLPFGADSALGDYVDELMQPDDGDSGDDDVNGTSSDEQLVSGAGNDRVSAGGGNDIIVAAAAGTDWYDGGLGIDVASFAGNAYAVDVNLLAGTASGLGIGHDTLVNIENVAGGDAGDLIVGSSGANHLDGGLGDDQLEGGAGNDTLDGGAGTDLASYAGSGSAVSVDLASLTLSGGDAAGDTLVSIEGIVGSVWDDDLRGDGQANVIFGGDGADYVLGRDGDDQISGDAGNDNLNGGNGNDTIIGGAGNDTIYGDAGDDHIEGGDGDDVLLGRSGLNGLWGQAGNDELYGDAGSDYLDGGDGDDTLYASGGTDGVIGGAGIDTYSAFPILGNNYNRLTIDLSAGSASGVEIGTDVLMSIENVIGSSHLDTIIGDANANRLDGGTQDDSLVGGDGNDTLIGGWHNDELFGGNGDDELHGDDYLGQTGYAGNDTISGGAGTDTAIFGAALAAVTVVLNGNVLTLTSTLGGTDEVSNDVEFLTFNGVSYTWTDIANIALGSDGIVTGTTGDDTIDLNYTDSLGESVHDSTTPADTVMADAGNDTVLLYAGDDTGYGEAGDDTIVGGAGADTLYGGLGNDSLDGGTGNDSLEGGDGSDIYVYLAGDGSDVVNDTGPSQDTDRIVFADIASTAVTYTSNGPDLMVHLPDGSVVTLRNQFGPGTTGIEQLQYSDNVTVNPDALGFAVPIYGTSGSDNLSGTSGNDTIHGMDGNDTIQGGDGADYLYGDGGNDTIIAGLGIDYFDGGDGHDMLNTGYTSAATVVDLVAGTVTFAATLTETAVNFEDVVTGNGNDQVTGNADNNLIITNGGNDVLSGGAGNDSLSGGSGADTLLGGDGDDHIKADIGIDVFDGGNGRDLLDTTYTSANVIVDLGAGTVNFAAQLTETATNFEDAKTAGGADQLLGTAADNTLTSGAGNDLLVGAGGYDGLNGEAGNDTLNGGAGDDTLTGGTGADRFVFDFSSGGNDIITDFNQLDGGAEESDLLVFQGLLVGTFSYLGSGAFTGGSDNSEARVSGSQVLVDTNGDGLSDFDITLTGLTNANQLGVDDFLFTV